MLKKIFVLFFLFCLFLTGCTKKEVSTVDDLAKIIQRDKIIVGVREDAPPFGFRDKNGNLTGYDIELSKIIAKGLLGNENKVEFIPVTASDRIMKLSAGEVDFLVATMSITNQRRQILNFSKPYYVAGQAILVRSDNKATGLKDFKGKKLIIVFGSTSERNLRTSVPEVEVIGYKNYKEAYNALKSGKAEGIVADDTILLGYALNDKSVKLLKKRYSKEPYAIAFRKENESLQLMNKIDYIIEHLQSTGQLNRMQEKWNIKK